MSPNRMKGGGRSSTHEATIRPARIFYSLEIMPRGERVVGPGILEGVGGM